MKNKIIILAALLGFSVGEIFSKAGGGVGSDTVDIEGCKKCSKTVTFPVQKISCGDCGSIDVGPSKDGGSCSDIKFVQKGPQGTLICKNTLLNDAFYIVKNNDKKSIIVRFYTKSGRQLDQKTIPSKSSQEFRFSPSLVNVQKDPIWVQAGFKINKKSEINDACPAVSTVEISSNIVNINDNAQSIAKEIKKLNISQDFFNWCIPSKNKIVDCSTFSDFCGCNEKISFL